MGKNHRPTPRYSHALGTRIRSAARDYPVSGRASPGLCIPDSNVKLITRTNAPATRSVGARKPSDHNLRIGPRGDSETNHVPRLTREPVARAVDQLNVGRVAGVGCLRAKTFTGNGDGLRLLRKNRADVGDLRWAVIRSATGNNRVFRRTSSGLNIPDADGQLITRPDAMGSPVASGESGEHDLGVGP